MSKFVPPNGLSVVRGYDSQYDLVEYKFTLDHYIRVAITGRADDDEEYRHTTLDYGLAAFADSVRKLFDKWGV